MVAIIFFPASPNFAHMNRTTRFSSRRTAAVAARNVIHAKAQAATVSDHVVASPKM